MMDIRLTPGHTDSEMKCDLQFDNEARFPIKILLTFVPVLDYTLPCGGPAKRSCKVCHLSDVRSVIYHPALSLWIQALAGITTSG